MTWRLFKVSFSVEGVDTVESVDEELDLSGVPSASSVSLILPKGSLDVDTYYKAVFKYEMETGSDVIKVYQESRTYFTMIRTPLVAIMIKGAATKITRGWDQEVSLEPGIWSQNPDDKDDKDFDYQWFCRVSSREENYTSWDVQGFPVWSAAEAQAIPTEEQTASPINPPGGCFGHGRPGPLKGKSGLLSVNTNRFVTYAQSYEFLVIVSKEDGRRAMATLEVDVGKIPAPVVEISCKGKDACKPFPGSLLVNPTKRLGGMRRRLGRRRILSTTPLTLNFLLLSGWPWRARARLPASGTSPTCG